MTRAAPPLALLVALALPLAPARAASCPEAPAQALSLPASRAAVAAGKPLVILAFGSSSTEGSGASAPSRTYPARLEARLRAALPGVPLEVVNRGRGGEEVLDMLRRLEDEVVAARPRLVIWQAGGNGALRRMDPELFRLAMESGLARLRETGADVVLMDNQVAPRIQAIPEHSRFGAAMARLAERLNLSLFSRTALMRRWQARAEAAQQPEEPMIGPDGLHHTDRGYDCLAEALSRSIVEAVQPPAVMAGRQ